MLNRNFGKLENGALVYAPSPLIIDGLQAFTNDAVILLSHGYKPIVQTDAPTQTGYHAVASWTESATQITQTWTLVEDAAPEPTQTEINTANIEYVAMMTDVELPGV